MTISLSRLVLFAGLSAPLMGVCQVAGSPHAPDGGSFERLQSISILPKPGAPFSATVVTEWTRLLEDGTTFTTRNHRLVARDSAGRIFEERRFFSPTGDKEETRLRALQYSDPTRHEYYDCAPATHLCMLSRYSRPATVPVLPANAASANGGPSVAREDLGHKTISDVDTVGSREITTVAAGGRQGYQRAEPTIKEFWYSPRLEINLVVKRFEPRGGAQSFTFENVSLAEPDPALFSAPDGYKLLRTDPDR